MTNKFTSPLSNSRIKNGKTVYTIEIPANTTAEIILPNEIEQTVVAGEYRFEL